MKFWRILIVVIMVVVSLVIASPVFAALTKYEYMDTNDDADSGQIYGGNYIAEIFKSNATVIHTVTQIAVDLKRVGTPGNVNVGLKAVSAGVPAGADLTSGTLNGSAMSTSQQFYKFDVPAYTLIPNTDYAIVVSLEGGVAATDYILWRNDSGGDGSANTVGLTSTNSGVSWTPGVPDYLFQIFGNTAFDVVDAIVVEDYVEDGDWLIVAECINLYPNYYNQTDPTIYFNVQLLNVAGTSVIAATTLKTWGDAPVAIYLSPSMVTSLTRGSPYIIRMWGTFTGNPTDPYVLSNTSTNNDWVGSDKRYLDQWCLKTAKSMNIYDNNTTSQPYTTKRSDGGEVLTTYGGGDFVIGIPSIMNVRPDLFQTSVRTPSYDPGTATNAFDNAATWQNQVGTQIATDATAFGAVIGVTAKQFLSIGIWAIYILSMIFVFASSKGQGAETVFVGLVNLPILYAGLHFRIIDFQVFGIMCVFAILLFLLKVWFSK